jgi:hypothetical protein
MALKESSCYALFQNILQGKRKDVVHGWATSWLGCFVPQQGWGFPKVDQQQRLVM